MKYDYLIVGCGLYGATIARRCLDLGKSVLIIDKRNHIAGNTYTESKLGIDIHKYGPHIFHTSNDKIWNFVNSFSKFNNYQHKGIANYCGRLYSLPFNMWTFYQFWEAKTPEEALETIEKQRYKGEPKNLEEQALSMVGSDIYLTLIKHYTAKQWNKDPKQLPASIIKRLPVRLSYNDNYFNDKYQGIPVEGYTTLIRNMIEGSSVVLNIDFFDKRSYWESMAKYIVYTGPIDKFFDYQFGHLEYRSLFFEEITLQKNNFQGTSIVNYTDPFTPYTRIVEHKHFNLNINNNHNQTIITKEYPADYKLNNEPYYPINDNLNSFKYTKYKNLVKSIENKYIFGGRLAEYKYYDMHQVIGSALNTSLY
jgi:UDP-galactopyranose mutase